VEVSGDSSVVWIQKENNTQKAINYMLEYITKSVGAGNQEGESYFWSQDWVYEGFVEDWKRWRRIYGKDAVKKWKEYMGGVISLRVPAMPTLCKGNFVYRDWTKSLEKSQGRFIKRMDVHIDG
jgi:hypothetical protein